MQPPVVRRRLAASAALAALTLTGLTACGGGDDSSAGPFEESSPADPTTSATAETTPTASVTPPDGPTEPTEEPSDTPGAAGGEPLTAGEFADIYKAAIDQATTADITLTTGGATALEGEGQIDFTTNPPEIAAVLSAAALGGEADVRLVDGTFFLKLPQLGPKFLTFDADDPSNPFGALFSSSLDPSALVEVFRTGTERASLVGEEDGLQHYSVSVRSEALLAQYPEELRDQAAGQLPPVVDYQMYFDDEGLLRRTTFDLGAAGTTTQTYDNWGTDVEIEAPPPGQVQVLPGR